MLDKDHISGWFQGLQDTICTELEKADGKGRFKADAWRRPGGGGGITKVLTNGNIIEKGGVNFSAVWGHLPETALQVMKIEGATEFFATGVSIVLHPFNPMMPIIHMNVRYFEIQSPEKVTKNTWWFGGGIDLTPHYINKEDARFFHQQLKEVCDRHHPDYYTRFKAWADDYFYIKHRQETRGIGGIFFDHLKEENGFSKGGRFEFVKDVGSAFVPVYTYFMKKNHSMPFSEKEKQWQHLRRGRYVEFNLVWDRGTKFGLETEGRTESILMSLPPQAQWVYDFKPEPGSEEEYTLNLLKKGLTWV